MFDDVLGQKEVKNTFGIKSIYYEGGESVKFDPAFLGGYIDNIAMLLHDYQHQQKEFLDFRDKDVRDKLATNIIDLIFN